jgi:hypothetical protein
MPADGAPVDAHWRRRVADVSAFILAHATATEALEAWCARTGLAPGPIRAELRAPVIAVVPTPEVVADLDLGPNERVWLRQVALIAAQIVLAEASNWFAPDRLPRALAQSLLTTEVPFGRLVAPLGGYRIETGVVIPARPPDPTAAVQVAFEHRAIVCRSFAAGEPAGDQVGQASRRVRLAVVHERFEVALLVGTGCVPRG